MACVVGGRVPFGRGPRRWLTVLYFGSILDITLDPIGTQPLPPVLFGVPQQRQVRAAAVALVDSRVPLKLNSGPYAGEPAGKNDGFRRSRTCMVPSPPEAHTAYIRYDRQASISNGEPSPNLLVLPQELRSMHGPKSAVADRWVISVEVHPATVCVEAVQITADCVH